MKISREKRGLAAIGGIFVVTALVTAVFSAAFFITSFTVQKLGLHPSAYLNLIINIWLGLLIAFLIGTLWGNFSRPRHLARTMGVFGLIIEAIERIAKGDFSVRLDNTYENVIPYRELINSVNSMAEELSQMEKMRQEFISNVSHEIQTPLTSIRGFAQALQNDQLSTEDRSHYLDIIAAESTRLSRITDNLLRLASLESEQVKFEPKPYRLDKQIRSLILACEPQWTSKNIELDVSMEEAVLTADEDLLSQVWINLIHNSIKFTPDGGRVCIELHRLADKFEFKIADTGIGISAVDRERVFERFYKADQSRQPSNEGSGLGLSIAKKIVEMHRGAIQVESQLGGGTTFTVVLPG